uniref:Uncharacterized protein n=1 Tax=Panagrolaimus sp. JU765 TaxID=591449 RepID=A0AC34RNH2_9BILA
MVAHCVKFESKVGQLVVLSGKNCFISLSFLLVFFFKKVCVKILLFFAIISGQTLLLKCLGVDKFVIFIHHFSSEGNWIQKKHLKTFGSKLPRKKLRV